MTVDVEDYFQVSAFEGAVDRDSWSSRDSRVERNTDAILEKFSDAGVRATFFVLGWVAEKYPALVRRIEEQSHEVACHGFSHKLVYNQSIDEFRSETKRSKSIIEDIIGRPVLGYRAASYSITKASLWAIDVLVECGFKYDSSIFPARHDRYGIPDAPIAPFSIVTSDGRKLVEYPISVARVLGANIPAAGGGYFRIYPYALSRGLLKRINNKQEQPFVFYLHPWEIDPDQPRMDGPWLSRFRHYHNLEKCSERFDRLISDFDFDTVSAVLERKDWPGNSLKQVALK